MDWFILMYRAVNTWMACSTYIFCPAKAEKEIASELEHNLSSYFFLCCCCFWLDSDHCQAELDLEVGIYLLHAITHPHTHTPLTPNHSRMAFTPTPRRAALPAEKAAWQHLNWHYVSLTLSTVTYCFSWKRLTWPQKPESHNDQTQTTHLTRFDWLPLKEVVHPDDGIPPEHPFKLYHDNPTSCITLFA